MSHVSALNTRREGSMKSMIFSDARYHLELRRTQAKKHLNQFFFSDKAGKKLNILFINQVYRYIYIQVALGKQISTRACR